MKRLQLVWLIIGLVLLTAKGFAGDHKPPILTTTAIIEVYPNKFKNWIFGCAKTVQFVDHK